MRRRAAPRLGTTVLLLGDGLRSSLPELKRQALRKFYREPKEVDRVQWFKRETAMLYWSYGHDLELLSGDRDLQPSMYGLVHPLVRWTQAFAG